MENDIQIFLHTGSNLGDRRAHLQEAIEKITATIGPVVNASRIYRTQAWGVADQPDFLNQALEIRSKLSPLEILDQVLQIEKEMGRARIKKWGQRLIDIDILFYGHTILKTERLTIPHPYLHHRNFVLIPMLEIAPDFVHPVFKLSISEMRSRSEDTLDVEALNND